MRPWVRRCAALIASVLVMTGCTSAPDTAPQPSPSEPSGARSSSPTVTPSPTSTASPEPPASLTVALAGDIHFEGALRDRLRDPATALTPATGPLAGSDVAIANLETSVGTGGGPAAGKRFTFSAGPEAFTALAAAGVDIATMANNHALDYGRDRLPSTFRAIDRAAGASPPLTVIGIGRDAEEAFRPAMTDVDGTVVATVTASLADQDPTADRTGQWAATDTAPGVADAIDPARLLAAVRKADREADVVVAYLHWGVQGDSCPSGDQRSLASRLVEAGADVVAGTHAHQLQGDGRLGSGYVAYGLGNFAWYSPGPTGVLTLTVRPPRRPAGRAQVTRTQWWPAEIGGDGLPRELRGQDAVVSQSRRVQLRGCTGLDPW